MSTTMERTKIRTNYKRIPGYSNYALSSSGDVYNISTGRDLTLLRNGKHWSGAYNLTNDNGGRECVSTADLFSITYNITREQTIRNRMGL